MATFRYALCKWPLSNRVLGVDANAGDITRSVLAGFREICPTLEAPQRTRARGVISTPTTAATIPIGREHVYVIQSTHLSTSGEALRLGYLSSWQCSNPSLE